MTVLDKDPNDEAFVKSYLDPRQQNSILSSSAGYTEIQNCLFNRSASKDALFYISNQEKINIFNSTFERIVGSKEYAIMTVLRNDLQDILMQDTVIKDSIAQYALSGILLGKITLNNL